MFGLGTTSEYPVLKVDFDEVGGANVAEFGTQERDTVSPT